MFASDIGHWDVPDIRDILPEAWELVGNGHLDEAQFREMTCGNVVRALTATNPRFFDGTVVAGVEKRFPSQPSQPSPPSRPGQPGQPGQPARPVTMGDTEGHWMRRYPDSTCGRSARSRPTIESVIGRIDEIVIDCANPSLLARFWSSVLGGEPVARDTSWHYVDPPGWTRVAFQRVPEGKLNKNRLHLDVAVSDIPLATAQAEALGARRVGDIRHDEDGSFQVLLDPEGNEWCVVQSA